MEGSNILGFFPGKFWNTAKDRPLIIGAHWDTVETTKGFNDNGSGVTVMLEISRILIGSKCFVPDFTIIFVAFDAEEEGAIGTQQFLNSIIVPYYKKQGVDIQVVNFSIKGQVISKGFFGVFNFFQKTNENISHSIRNEFICSFFGRIHSLTICF